MKKILSLCFLITISQGLQAQWSAVGTGVNSSCDVLDVYNGQLIAAGRYSQLTTWNGSEWSILNGGPSATAILVDGDEIYTGGQFTGGEGAKVISYYDGNTWSILGGSIDAYDLVDWNTNYKWAEIFKYNDDIYGTYAGKLLRYDSGLEQMALVGDAAADLGEVPPVSYVGTMNNLTYYRSYVDSVERVVTWNNTTYDTLNLSEYPVRFLNSMKMWNGELYMSGAFQNLQGDLYAIVKWNGVSLIPVLAYNMEVPYIFLHSTSSFLFGMYYADLYSRMAVWTGSGFQEIAVDGGGDAVAELNGIIYVGGFFTSFAGVEANNIAQREFVLTTNHTRQKRTFSLAPNPAINGYTETTPSPVSRQVHIYSITGQLVQSQNLQAGESKISIGNLRSGVYIVELMTESETAINRLVVQ